MAKTTDVIVIDPSGITMTVDILDSFGVSVTAYTAAGGSSTHSLPLSISAPTTFYLTKPDEYTVSAKLRGNEIAGPAGVVATASVHHGVPVTIRPKLNPSEIAALLTKFGPSASGSTPGTCVKKIEVFDSAGVSLGFLAVYDAIT